MTTDDLLNAAKTGATIMGSAATTVLWVHRRIDNLITKRVKEQVSAAMESVTETTSQQIASLRSDVKDELREGREENRDSLTEVTKRLDTILLHLVK